MHKPHLLHRLSKEADPPCQSLSSQCEWYGRCATEHLSCEAFQQYVRRGRGDRLRHQVPSRWRYLAMTQEDA